MIGVHLLEDITPGVQRQKDWQTPGGVAPLAECMFMGQRYAMGTIYVTHVLSSTSPIIRQNAQTIIVTGLPGESPRLICDTLGVTAEMADRIKTLRPGEFAILNPVLWDKCVYATFEKPQIPGKLQEYERRRAVESFLRKVKAAAPAPLNVFRPATLVGTSVEGSYSSVAKTLSSSQMQMLVCIATGILQHICKVYQTMGVSRTQGGRIVKSLELMGAIILYSVSAPRRGGQLSLPLATDYGWQILEKSGFSKPTPKTKGGPLHEATARRIEACEKAQSRKVIFEPDFGGRRPDLGSFDTRTGARTFFNIGLTDPAREPRNIEAILKLPVMQTSKFVFVARDMKFAREVAKLLTDKDPSGKLLTSVEIKTIADFVEAE
jgi:hypothetical protein